MKKIFILAGILVIPSLSFADRLGSLRSNAQVALSTQIVTGGNTNYVNVDPLSVQPGAFNISSGTVDSSLNLPYTTFGNCLETDAAGKVISAAAPCGSGGGTPGGSSGQIQYNAAGSFGGGPFWDDTNLFLGLGTTIPEAIIHQKTTSPTTLGMILHWNTFSPTSPVDFVRFRYAGGTSDTVSIGHRAASIGLGGGASDTAGTYIKDSNGAEILKMDGGAYYGLHISTGGIAKWGKARLNVYGGAMIGVPYGRTNTVPDNGLVVNGPAVFITTMTLSGGSTVQINSPSDGQTLVYRSATGWWGNETPTSGGGGGGTTIWSKKDGTNLDTSVSTINFLTGGGLTATSAPGGQINIGLSPGSTYFLGLGVAATTYATQVDVTQSTTQLNSQFANYQTTGSAYATYLPITVAATTYQTIQNVLTSTTQLNSQFANYATTQTTLNLSNTFANYTTTQTALNITNTFNNYYSSGATQNLFNLKTVDATTYALQTVVQQSTAQLNSQFANYLTTGGANATFLPITVAATTYVTPVQVLGSLPNPSTNYAAITQGYNGNTPLAIATGSAVGFNGTISTQTKVILLSTTDFNASLQGGSTAYFQIGIGSVTKQGVLRASTNITLTPSAGFLDIAATGGSAGTPATLAIATGSRMGFNGTISSPTSVVLLSTANFQAQLQGGSTALFELNPSSVTLSGALVAGANVTITPNGNGTTTIAATGGGGGSGTTIMFREEGVDVVASSTMNVIGTNATITNSGGVATLTITGGGGGFEIYPATNTIWANSGIQTSTVAASSVTIGVPVGSAPSARWVLSEGTTGQAPLSGSTAHIIGLDGNPLRLTLDTHSSASNFGTLIASRRSRGTSLAPTAVQSNDVLMQLGGLGYATTGYSATSMGIMAIKASELWTSTGQGTFIEVFTTSNTSLNPQKRLEIANDGTVAVQGTKFGVSRSTFVYENGLPSVTSFQTVSSSGVVTWTAVGTMNVSSTSFSSPMGTLGTREIAVATVTITTSRTDSKVELIGNVSIAKDAGTTARLTTVSIRRGTTGSNADILISTPTVYLSQAIASATHTVTMMGIDAPGTPGTYTYSIRVLLGAGISTSTVKNFTAKELNGYMGITVSTANYETWTNASYVLHATNTWNTNNSTSPFFGQAVFNGSISTATNNNYLKWFAPNDFDPAATPRCNFSFGYGGVDTSSQTYIVSIASVSHGALLTALNFTNPITMTILNTSGDDFKVGVSSETTLTNWNTFIQAGVHHVIRIARQGDSTTLDPSAVNSFFDKFVLYFKRRS